MNLWCFTVLVLFYAPLWVSTAYGARRQHDEENESNDYTNPNAVSASNEAYLGTTDVPLLTPDTTYDSMLLGNDNADDAVIGGATGDHSGENNIPLPIIIVFIFMFTMLGVICIQQLQRMFAENKEYNDIRFDIRENRATLRSGKTYGTVQIGENSRKNTKHANKGSNRSTNGDDENDDYFQTSRVVTGMSETDEKVACMADAEDGDNGHGHSNSNSSNSSMDGSSDESVELGSGYDTNSKARDSAANKASTTDAQKTKKTEKIKQQVMVATQGLKDKIEKKLHGSKLNPKKSKYKGYGTLRHGKQNGVNDDEEDDDTSDNSELDDRDQRKANRGNDGNECEFEHPGYGMNYGYSEDYDCDFEDSDTQLSEEGDDKERNCQTNETIIQCRVVLE